MGEPAQQSILRRPPHGKFGDAALDSGVDHTLSRCQPRHVADATAPLHDTSRKLSLVQVGQRSIARPDAECPSLPWRNRPPRGRLHGESQPGCLNTPVHKMTSAMDHRRSRVDIRHQGMRTTELHLAHPAETPSGAAELDVLRFGALWLPGPDRRRAATFLDGCLRHADIAVRPRGTTATR